jgi:hypothetical protein
MRKIAYFVVSSLCASPVFAQTRIAFTTDRAAFVDDAQKGRDKAVKQLVEDFSSRQKKDRVQVVSDPAEAQIVITVLSMGWDPNGEATTRRGVFGGAESTATLAEHMVVELRAGDYTTKIEGWRTIIQSSEDQVGREIRRWLKDNAAQLVQP